MGKQTPVFEVEMVGFGQKLPRERYSNRRLIREFELDSTAKETFDLTGMRFRHLCTGGENVVTLGAEAGLRALRYAGIEAPAEIDYLFVASSTADTYRPINGAHPGIHKLLNEKGYHAVASDDRNLACTGFVNALEAGYKRFNTDGIDLALVVGTEALSKKIGFFDKPPATIDALEAAYETSKDSGIEIDPDLAVAIEALLGELGHRDKIDRGTASVLADGSGAVVLARQPGSKSGMHGWWQETDSSEEEILYANSGEYVYMNGREVLKVARRVMVQIGNAALEKANENTGFKREQIDWVVPHQANIRIIEYANEKLGFKPEQLIVDLDRHGNTSTASIPLALRRAVVDGRIKKGDNILMPGFGGGMTYEALVLTV
ncbi:TPA: hypothetical protein DIS56_01625 [Candidatus Saccharibacteria bacterium]|nr:MAG: hypothetical protein A3F05_03665 [Candidatus Saccharibacteria bacterium RIFCSPHIGHO2_12_FULL_47_17]HCM51813.1 hypothetical protein [Candidatus Saccharibacteria bacterium]